MPRSQNFFWLPDEMMNSLLKTPLCDLLGCDVPIVLAGMGGVARSDLVTAVTAAGGFGLLGMVRESPDLITAEIARVRSLCTRDFGVSLIPAATPPELFAAELAACIAAEVPAVALFWDLSADAIARLRAANILVLCQVGSTDEARAAVKAGAQVIIAQGAEAGGHVRGITPLRSLLAEMVSELQVPVLAAGGLVDGHDVAQVLAMGAQGAVIGTAFLATEESFAHEYHKQRIVEAPQGAPLRTRAFHVNWPPNADVRVLPNSVTEGRRGDPFSGMRTVIGHEGSRRIWLFSTDSPLRDMTGDFEAMALYAGEGVGKITTRVPAAERLRSICAEAEQVLSSASEDADTSLTRQDEDPEPASRICYARQSDDVYAGFAPREEILVFLNELLEAERAGARITARTALDARDETLAALMQDIRRDEAHWCAMLLKWISVLNGTASPRIGDFYGKCLAISDLHERARFINRGQGWVVKRLKAMLPRIRDDALHADLVAMLDGHDANIHRSETVLSERTAAGAAG
jgi:nitronate monooxygenase